MQHHCIPENDLAQNIPHREGARDEAHARVRTYYGAHHLTIETPAGTAGGERSEGGSRAGPLDPIYE